MVALLITNNVDKYINGNRLAKKLSKNTYYISEDLLSSESIELASEAFVYKSKVSQSYGVIGEDCSMISYTFNNHILELKRDKLGMNPVYYLNNQELFVVSDSLSLIKSLLPGIGEKVNEKWLFKALYGVPPSVEDTFCKDVMMVPPAHTLVYDGLSVKLERYWRLNEGTCSESHEGLDVFFLDALASRLGQSNGAELSGGLDSSGVVGGLSFLLKGSEIEAFRHVMSDKDKERFFPFSDERVYSQAVVDFCDNINIHDVTSERVSVIADLKSEMKVMSSPFYSGLSLFSNQLLSSAEQKSVDVLFSGFGGDELVSSKAAVYVSELIKANRWPTLFKETQNVFALKQLFKHVVGNEGADWLVAKKNNALLRHEKAMENDLEALFWEHHNSFAQNTLKASFVSKLNNPALVHRIAESRILSKSKGISYAYPLLDANLLEAFMSVPSAQIYNHSMPRHLYRKIISPYLPKEIVYRKNKTRAAVPTVFSRFMREYDTILDFLYTYKQGAAAEYVDVDKMIGMMPLIRKKSLGQLNNERLDLRIFLIGLQSILFFDERVLF